MATVRPGIPDRNLRLLMGPAVLRERGGVRYHELRSRSLLNRCDSPRMPFQWTVNPYRGCAMGCRYCYAAYTHGFMGIDTPEDFHSVVYVKTGAEAETARRMLPVVRRGELIALGTATDPFLPALTDGEAGLDALLAAAAAVGVRAAACNILFLRSPTREKYLRWIAREFPRYRAAYEEAYDGRVYLGGRYRERLHALVRRLREKHGLANAFGNEPSPGRPAAPAQLRLWA